MVVSAALGCRLCAIAASDVERAGFDVPIIREKDFFAIASLGGFIDGWSLVCPNNHRANLLVDYEGGALYDTVGSVVEAVECEFGPAVVFEHGPRGEASETGCGTCHAHMHVVPFGGSILALSKVADSSLSWQTVCVSDLQAVVGDSEYLFAADAYDGSRTVGAVAVLSAPRSQFFRRVLASAIGSSESSDYRIAPFERNAESTSMRLRSILRRARCAA